MTTTDTFERPSRLHIEKIGILAIMLLAMIGQSSGGEQSQEASRNIPAEIRRCMQTLGSDFALSSSVSPFYLRGDFFGDGNPVYAALIHKGDLQGIVICRRVATGRALLGAGNDFNKMKNLNFTAWRIHPKSVPVEQGVEAGRPPHLLGDAILLNWEETASGLVYWDGRRFEWYQQGD